MRTEDHTFVICAFKESPYLEECIKSLKEQTIQSKIVMITSTPNNFINGMAKRYNIPLLVNTASSGIAQDWNFAYEQSYSKYITLVHQDDYYMPEYLQTVMAQLKNRKKPLIFFCNYGEIRNEEKIVNSKLLKIKRLMLFPLTIRLLQRCKWVRRRILSFGNPICCPSVTYCKDRLPQPIFSVGYKSNIDWQAWDMISKLNGEFIYCTQLLVFHRIHRASTTSELMEQNMRWKEDYQMFCQFWPKSVAKLLVHIYRNSEKSNNIN